MRDIVTLSGKPVSRLGLAASADMDERCVQAAFEGGVTYFFFYNLSFAPMIAGLRPLLQKRREEVFVACGSEEREPGALRRDLDRIRKSLGVDLLDAFHAEYVSPADESEEVFGPDGALAEVRRWRDAGLVRCVAASVHSRTLAVDLIESGRIELLMTRYNMAHRGAEEKAFPAALKAGIPVVSFTCTRWGSLLKRPAAWGDRPVPTAADCYRFVLRHPAVRVALTAPGTVKRLSDNLSVLRDGSAIPPEQYRIWEEYGRRVYGDGKGAFETRWP
ncbi:MAG: oxidoreductase [Candidatus Handelsmanbacteria bacterium RIFCSPLOWO2_12_FULL_64_10]|uniref:Oxidoreductase n=1 Tax=Handelsmanbacteria sp. (strain RIFCSPLOWO2_12_FULL_64_10) TaxID=1817868 RepID=A0A1F6D4Q2_HANXR|nr:MAG: oxidoreductase [Candidatus Handelsmanbacteria bacterium RIFCSPLOWO2_12_FULL_64_10]